MPRASGNDLCEIFGFAPDDTHEKARKQWKSQECPFVGGTCIKHSHPQADDRVVVYGSCSVTNQTRRGKEEVILCPQRLYANKYETLKSCAADALGRSIPTYLCNEYSRAKRSGSLPQEYAILVGQKSGCEINLRSEDAGVQLSIDWVVICVSGGQIQMIIPCEVQSIDTTGNYHANWRAYAEEKAQIPDSKHGMNWANVWKRLIPQLILKGAIAKTSSLCKAGLYFVVPDRVYLQFEKLVGPVAVPKKGGNDTLTVMTYALGPNVSQGNIRQLCLKRTVRMSIQDFATAFSSGKQLPLGSQLDEKAVEIFQSL